MQIRPRLHFDQGLLAMVQEGRGQPESTPVFVHDLGRGTRAGEEPGVEMGELGNERAAHDHAGGAVADRLAGYVEDILPVEGEERVRRRPGTRGPNPARRPR